MIRALLVLAAACSGSQDAPRPIGESPAGADPEGGMNRVYSDDDGDGIPNDHDGCPLAREDEAAQGLDRDGCPDAPRDAGT